MFDKLNLILPVEAFGGPMQMALDEVLLRSMCRPTLRIYRWGAPCVSFGYFQKLAEVHRSHPNTPLVRRWTGGGMVEHGNDLTFSLLVPRGHPAAISSPAAFYKELHNLIAGGLNRSLVASEPFAHSRIRLAGEGDLLSGPFCFSAPAPNDLLLGGRKILGGAQRRSEGALLYQGSIQGIRHQEEAMFAENLAQSLSALVSKTELSPSDVVKAQDLSKVRYSSDEWTKRR